MVEGAVSQPAPSAIAGPRSNPGKDMEIFFFVFLSFIFKRQFD